MSVCPTANPPSLSSAEQSTVGRERCANFLFEVFFSQECMGKMYYSTKGNLRSCAMCVHASQQIFMVWCCMYITVFYNNDKRMWTQECGKYPYCVALKKQSVHDMLQLCCSQCAQYSERHWCGSLHDRQTMFLNCPSCAAAVSWPFILPLFKTMSCSGLGHISGAGGGGKNRALTLWPRVGPERISFWGHWPKPYCPATLEIDQQKSYIEKE